MWVYNKPYGVCAMNNTLSAAENAVSSDFIKMKEGVVYKLRERSNDFTRLLALELVQIRVMIASEGKVQLFTESMREIYYPCDGAKVGLICKNNEYYVHPSDLIEEMLCDLRDSYVFIIRQARTGEVVEITERIFNKFSEMKIISRNERGFLAVDLQEKGKCFVCIKGKDGKHYVLFRNFYDGRAILQNGIVVGEENLRGFLQASLQTIAWFSAKVQLLSMDKNSMSIPAEFYKSRLPKLIAAQFSKVNGVGEITNEMIEAEFNGSGSQIKVSKFKLFVFTWSNDHSTGIQVNTLGKFIHRGTIDYMNHIVSDLQWH